MLGLRARPHVCVLAVRVGPFYSLSRFPLVWSSGGAGAQVMNKLIRGKLARNRFAKIKAGVSLRLLQVRRVGPTSHLLFGFGN